MLTHGRSISRSIERLGVAVRTIIADRPRTDPYKRHYRVKCASAHFMHWTKPLRGRWWCGSRVGLTDRPRCFLESSCKSLCERMEQLLPAANSISQRSIHDLSTTPHDRGHANPQLSSEHPRVLHSTGLPIRTVFPEVAGSFGTLAHSGLPALLDE